METLCIVWAASGFNGAHQVWAKVNPLQPFTAMKAHALAREWRKLNPADLYAVRGVDAGPPVHAETMIDFYDLPPYI